MPRRPANPMTKAVQDAVKAATHLQPEDAALIEVAVQLARVIDSAAGEDPATWRKQTGWVSPHLLGVLRGLGLTPDTRDLRDKYSDQGSDLLAELRAKRRAQLSPELQEAHDNPGRLNELRRYGVKAIEATAKDPAEG